MVPEKGGVMSNARCDFKVAVLVETEFIPDEIKKYKEYFEEKGGVVDFLTLLNGNKQRVLVGDVTEPGKSVETFLATKDIQDADADNYDIILCAANYVACRLREIPPMYSLGSSDKMEDAPAVKFIKKAMENKNIVKGFLCHALWLLTPIPEVLRGRIVVCHTVVLADIINAGAKFIGDILLVDAKCEFSDDYHIVIDDDMVTGRSVADIDNYVEAIYKTYVKRKSSL